MNAQNIYDDPEFLAGYRSLDRQVHGLDGASEWPSLRALLPDPADRRVIDLGCGFGWFGRWADEHGAAAVTGFDLSEQMLAGAADRTTSDRVEFVRADLDDLVLEPDSVELVFSSLALHYVHDLDRLLGTVAGALAHDGVFVASVEHPIYSAPTSQEFETSAAGTRIWPLDRYLVEGERVTDWFVDGVRKQHRTVATYVNALVDAGLVVDRLVEWGPSPDEIERRPALADDLDRPWFLLIRASRRS